MLRLGEEHNTPQFSKIAKEFLEEIEPFIDQYNNDMGDSTQTKNYTSAERT
jgi:hypothetical protein